MVIIISLFFKFISTTTVLDQTQNGSQLEKQLPSLLSLKVDPPGQIPDGGNPEVVVLPQALEDVLALKNQRALELGMEETINEESATVQDKDVTAWERDELVDLAIISIEIFTIFIHYFQDNDVETSEKKDNTKVSKNKRKKKRKKNRKNQMQKDKENEEKSGENDDVEVE